MSDLSALLGGVSQTDTGSEGAAATQDQGTQDQGTTPKSKRQHPKPDNIKHYEQVTGNTYHWDDTGGGWVDQDGKTFDSILGGTKTGQKKPAAKSKTGDQGTQDTGAAARKAFANGDYASAYSALKDDPNAQTDPVLKQVLALSKSYMGL